MGCECVDGDTHVALVTVCEVLLAADTAYVAFVAVEWLFVGGHPEVAKVTVVFSKLDVAFYAFVPEQG